MSAHVVQYIHASELPIRVDKSASAVRLLSREACTVQYAEVRHFAAGEKHEIPSLIRAAEDRAVVGMEQQA